MSEDERYRTSTQYRLWSYSPSSLHSLRSKTNSIAASRVRAAVQRLREARATSSNNDSEAENGRSVSTIPEGEVDCLTVEEELKLVAFYCRQTIQLGDHLKVPTDVKVYLFLATILQFEMECLWGSTGYSNPIPKTVLHNQLPHDLPPHRHPQNRPLLCHKNRAPLLQTHQIRRRNRWHKT